MKQLLKDDQTEKTTIPAIFWRVLLYPKIFPVFLTKIHFLHTFFSFNLAYYI